MNLKLEKDIPTLALLSQLWGYSLLAFQPSQMLKAWGLFPKNEIGSYPATSLVQGQGQYYCLEYPSPCYLEHQPPDYDRVEDFDRTADLYAFCIRPFAQPIYQETLKLMRPLLVPSARILDLGCGPGTETVELALHVPEGEVVGIDLASQMIVTASQKAHRQGIRNTAFFQADAADLPQHFEARFDIVYCSLAFHHYPDPLRTLREVRRVLNETGKAVIADSSVGWFTLLGKPLAEWGDPGWVGFYTGEGFQSLFREAGFSDYYWTEVLPGIGVCIGTK